MKNGTFMGLAYSLAIASHEAYQLSRLFRKSVIAAPVAQLDRAAVS